MCCVFRYGKIYVKAANSCMSKGADYAKKEIQRLERLLLKVYNSLFRNSLILRKILGWICKLFAVGPFFRRGRKSL